MTELFQRNKTTISRHIKNIYESGELEQNRTVAKNATVQNKKLRKVECNIAHYNLDMIISVGYSQLTSWHAIPPVGYAGVEGVYAKGQNSMIS